MRPWARLLALAAVLGWGCGGDASDSKGPPASPGDDLAAVEDAAAADFLSGEDAALMEDPGAPEDGSSGPDVSDEGAAPGGPPAPPAYSGGACPDLHAGAVQIQSGGMVRDLTITLPDEPQGAGVLFLWHGFGDTHDHFSAALSAGSISKLHDVITVSPGAVLDPMESEKLAPFKEAAQQLVGPMPPVWSLLDGPALDLALFDDLRACLDGQYHVDPARLYTMGFSQGALWSTVLVLERSEALASALLWSGGLGSNDGLIEVVWLEYQPPARRIPVLAAAGGEQDLWPNAMMALVNFQTGSKLLVESLTKDGHTAFFCDHGLGHTIPQDGLQWGLKFLFDHAWTPDGQSPYAGHDGSGFPAYCDF